MKHWKIALKIVALIGFAWLAYFTHLQFRTAEYAHQAAQVEVQKTWTSLETNPNLLKQYLQDEKEEIQTSKEVSTWSWISQLLFLSPSILFLLLLDQMCIEPFRNFLKKKEFKVKERPNRKISGLLAGIASALLLFLLFPLVILSHGNLLVAGMSVHFLAGIVGFWIFSGSPFPFSNWNLAKTGTLTVFTVLGFAALAALVHPESYTPSEA
jgi:hypothetical protein